MNLWNRRFLFLVAVFIQSKLDKDKSLAFKLLNEFEVEQ